MSEWPLCACGRPLHYTNPANREIVERMIESAGGDQCVTVSVGRRRWRVQRHYIALHGISAVELMSGATDFEELPPMVVES